MAGHDSQGETLELTPEPVVPDPALDPDQVQTDAPPTLHHVHRRPFGIHPVPLLGGLGSLALLAAIVLLAAGSLVGGLIVLVLAAASLTLFFAGVRREPDAPAARGTLSVIDRSRSLTRLVAVAIRAWGRGGLGLLRIRRRQHRLRSELQDRLRPLGEAAYREDEERVERLKRRAAEIEQRLKEAAREASAMIASTRQEIDDERAIVAPTEAFAPVRREPSGE
jgi:hypothetical protein